MTGSDSATMSGFETTDYSFESKKRSVLKIGQDGPAVIVIHEAYGMTPSLARFCHWVSDAGFRVYAPVLLGKPDTSNQEKATIGLMLRICVSREFTIFAQNRSSPIVNWLKLLARQAHAECGGAGVGAIGMCLTGGFALSMAVDPVVLCPVLGQPGLPATAPAALDISKTDLGIVRKRTIDEGLVVRGYRFEGDTICRASIFETLTRELGDAFIGVTLPDTAANTQGPMTKTGKPPHAVFTGELIDEPGQPTRAAVDEVIRFFREKLGSKTEPRPIVD